MSDVRVTGTFSSLWYTLDWQLYGALCMHIVDTRTHTNTNKHIVRDGQGLMQTSILSRQSLGGVVVFKVGSSDPAEVDMVCSMMLLHLLWKLGCLGDRWPDACWLCHCACSPPSPGRHENKCTSCQKLANQK